MPLGHHSNRTTIVQPVVAGGPAFGAPIVQGMPVVTSAPVFHETVTTAPVFHETVPVVHETLVHETMPVVHEVAPIMHGGVTRTTTTVTTTEY